MNSMSSPFEGKMERHNGPIKIFIEQAVTEVLSLERVSHPVLAN
jgi:hypothetical protein